MTAGSRDQEFQRCLKCTGRMLGQKKARTEKVVNLYVSSRFLERWQRVDLSTEARVRAVRPGGLSEGGGIADGVTEPCLSVRCLPL